MFLTSALYLLSALLCYGSAYIQYHPKMTAEKPKWPQKFFIQGILSLPYAELQEPFSSWYDGINKCSRVDMYGGISKTVQHADKGLYGEHYMVVPVTNEKVLNRRTCFAVNGTADARVKIQSLLPDITNFTYIGDNSFMDSDVNVWQYKVTNGAKVNKYTLYVDSSAPHVPLMYRMDGYNSLIGSHYDEYIITYTLTSYSGFPSTVFDTPMSGLNCHGFPGPGEGEIVANPMKEYIHPVDDSHVHQMHKDFLKKYNKVVDDNYAIRFKRKETFKHNLRYISSMNRNNLPFKLKVNHLAEHSSEELRQLRGLRTTPRAKRGATNAKEFTATVSADKLPTDLNWRLYGAVTPVKDQGVCGSCWSFGSTGTVEGTLFLKTGKRIRLSQQNLVDCSWGFGNNGCDGGEQFRSFEYMLKHGGLSSEEDYGHYLAVDGFCHSSAVPKAVKITGYINVPSGNITALQVALLQAGPISVGIDAAHPSFVFYSHGVYYDPKCGKREQDLDHAVLAVGYGSMFGLPYWLVKNSWSTHWGNDGYVLMSRKDNNCGVATDASYVTMH